MTQPTVTVIKPQYLERCKLCELTQDIINSKHQSFRPDPGVQRSLKPNPFGGLKFCMLFILAALRVFETYFSSWTGQMQESKCQCLSLECSKLDLRFN